MNLLSKKRYELLSIVDKYGVLSRKQIRNFMKFSEQNLVSALKQLEELNLILRFNLSSGSIYYITKSGSEFVGLINRGYISSEKKEPNLASLSHNLKVNDCILKQYQEYAEQDFQGIKIVSEREILKNVYEDIELNYTNDRSRQLKMRAGRRVPDFIFEIVMANGKKVIQAFEVELTRKNKNALKDKLLWYAKNQGDWFTSVIYFYEEESIKTYVENMWQSSSDLGVVNLFFKKMD
ncbi:MAG: replication-relaxation family protein [Tetragenococcus koreensis]|nr:replication-relaxation family protein [Tetragenococcus koreensis]